MTTSASIFRIDRRGPVAWLRMTHGKVNAMDIEFCTKLVASLDGLAGDDGTTAVVLLGNERVFSAGVDLKRWLREGPDYVEPFLEMLEQSFASVFLFPKPIVAAIQGHAIAGGCMIACACDYRLIAPDARIGIPELRIGVPLPMTAIEIVRFVAAPSAFQRIVNVGATFIGQAAVGVGLADAVAPLESMATQATQVVTEYTSVPLKTFQFSKRQIREPVLRQIEANKALLFDEYLELWKSSATRASVAEYVRERLGGQ